MAWVNLHSTAARGDLDQLRRHWWLKKFLINRRNADKQTPLHLACINGHADVVRFLVGKNCKLNPRGKYKKSPLIQAVQHQHRDCVAILLEHGANHDHRAVTGNTALHFAVLVSSKSLVELLLEHGADIDAKNELGYTPLTLAITERCKGMIEFLLQKGADVNATDNHERTPMEVAAVLKDKDTVEVLLHNGGVMNKGYTGEFSARDFDELFRDEFIAKEGGEYEYSERKGQCSARGTEEINSSCSGTNADTLLTTPALPESCKTLRYQGGILTGVREEQRKDKDSPWDSETDSKGQGKVSADPTLPAAVGKSLDACSVGVEHCKGLLPAAGKEKKEDNDFSWEDDDFSWAFETDSKGQEKVSADLTLPAAVCNSLDVRSVAVEHCKGILPAAGAELKEYFVPSSKNKLSTLEAEDLQLRSDSSSQTDSQVDRQVTPIE
ncbi:POTE ankyrin domain family member B2-like, partial [Neopelma chrysocephalum]|uniref:POTE ankyrin domain family member B2-like n=1 Tax=Neopelma chrysocephalum TaxID=114329 RepID=UPI000FCCF6F8